MPCKHTRIDGAAMTAMSTRSWNSPALAGSGARGPVCVQAGHVDRIRRPWFGAEGGGVCGDARALCSAYHGFHHHHGRLQGVVKASHSLQWGPLLFPSFSRGTIYAAPFPDRTWTSPSGSESEHL